MRKMQSLSAVWGIVMFVLVAAVGLYAAHYTKNKKYIELETKIVELIKNDKKIMEEIKSANRYTVINDTIKNKIDLNVDGDRCTGEIKIIKTFMGNIYQPKLFCENYKTFVIFK